MDIRGRGRSGLEAGDPLLYEDSYGRACIGVNQGIGGRVARPRATGHRLELRRPLIRTGAGRYTAPGTL